jgi:hypothetical protein
MSRPLPAALQRRSGTSSAAPLTPPEANAAPGPAPLIVYLAVPHPKLLDAIRKSRAFVSASATRPVELRAFHAPDFPDLPPEALRLLGNLTEIGEVVDQPLEIITPETLP